MIVVADRAHEIKAAISAIVTVAIEERGQSSRLTDEEQARIRKLLAVLDPAEVDGLIAEVIEEVLGR